MGQKVANRAVVYDVGEFGDSRAIALCVVRGVYTTLCYRVYEQNRGWAQQLYWNTGELVGGDPLNNALMAIWGWLRGRCVVAKLRWE